MFGRKCPFCQYFELVSVFKSLHTMVKVSGFRDPPVIFFSILCKNLHNKTNCHMWNPWILCWKTFSFEKGSCVFVWSKNCRHVFETFKESKLNMWYPIQWISCNDISSLCFKMFSCFYKVRKPIRQGLLWNLSIWGREKTEQMHKQIGNCFGILMDFH